MSTQVPAVEKAPPSHSASDLEAGNLNLLDSADGGASLRRQISVQLSPEQFERLYLQPGGAQAKGDLTKRFGNPTGLGIASFLLCLTPFSVYLMGWMGTSTAAAATLTGAMYFMGGLGLMVAGLLEWILGNTFPFIVFFSFGSFWLSFGYLLQPSQGIAASLAENTVDYNGGIAAYLIWWSVLVLVYLVGSIRTNVVFILLFSFLEITFWLLVAVYIRLTYGATDVTGIMRAAGAFALLTCVMGWYLLTVLIFDSVGIPVKLPIGDMSDVWASRARRRRNE
ncbi:hypothetical protein JCM6882_008955 [Rhodosporidiobolus microsporus]